ncbi:hypothetical protein LCGC14_1470130 [marine sediment metagenome]|uniref:Uncharacterized protein n=1 Tax=marine sediment metagenome TaxID=412755 RepID=A0A0F9LT08_9ZZZZ
MEITKTENRVLICLLKNEIQSTISFLDDVKGKEKEFWKRHIVELKGVLIK